MCTILFDKNNANWVNVFTRNEYKKVNLEYTHDVDKKVSCNVIQGVICKFLKKEIIPCKLKFHIHMCS